MHARIVVVLLVLFASLTSAHAEDSSKINFDAPPEQWHRLKLFDIVLTMPQTALSTLRYSVAKDSVVPWVATAVTTALTLKYDSDIYREVQGRGRQWNLGNDDKTKAYVKWKKYDLFRGPSDTGSGLYFLGDGWTHMSIAMGFLATGYFSDSTRPWNTGIQLFQGLTLSTILTQGMKRAFGREDPIVRTTPTGAWHPFPSIKAYNTHKSTLDAYPSGHITVVTLTFNTIRYNYPEYSAYIWPVQIIWSAGLMFQMINNGVHWASDYPLGIALGYFFSRGVHELGLPKKDEAAKASLWKPDVIPLVSADGHLLTGLHWSY